MANVGRPPIYNSPEDMIKGIEDYFNSNNSGITITGLCIHLGFESRQSFYAYEQKPEFSYIVKRARLFIENYYEKSAQNAKTPTFQIFALKNMGWSDKTEIDHTSAGEKLDTSTKIVFSKGSKK